MTVRIEWRTKGKGDDALVLVGDYGEAPNTVMKAWAADRDLLTDFLNDMARLEPVNTRLETDVNQRDPKHWGKLVLARAAQRGGDVLDIDPEIYWDGIYYWFRSRGLDPHPWRGRKG
jgi:hypothetical protein